MYSKKVILSIVITTKNRKEDLLACIDSIKKSKKIPTDWELIIVDDNSSDGTEKITSKSLKIKNISVIHNKMSQMMVRSRNIGARNARGEFILFIDDDNIVEPSMINRLINEARKNPEYGILGPSMYSYFSKKKYLDYQKISFYTGKTSGLIDDKNRNIVDSDGVPNVFLIRKKVFGINGYFDEKLVQTFTEPDFSFSCVQRGFKSGIVEKAITYHKVKIEDGLTARALGGKFNQKAYCLMRNRSVIVSRYGNPLQKIVYFSLFSWFWPLIYSLLMFPRKRFDLIKIYWLGFYDGVIYMLTGKLRWSFSTQ